MFTLALVEISMAMMILGDATNFILITLFSYVSAHISSTEERLHFHMHDDPCAVLKFPCTATSKLLSDFPHFQLL
jgi:hypothetical protein